ncbi:MAG: Bug family tripartite tricarboxylate transporter substrate binding protein, partial [Burkholderiales bacterium]
PIKIVVGFAAGTPPDTFARIYGEFLAKRLGVAVVIDSKPGASGNLATDAVAKAPADGYTFLYNLSTAFTVNPYIYTKLPYDPAKDLVPVATTMRQGLVLVASPARVPAKTLKELLATAKAQPGALSYGSYGSGSPSHLVMEWLKEETKTDILHVAYRASPLNELVGGQIEMMMEPVASAHPFITTGRVKAIAYSGSTRHPAMPDVPTISETAPGVSIMSWHGIWAPAATPAAIVERFNAEMVNASRDPEVQQRIKALNCEPLGVTPAEMAAMVKRDADIFSRIVKAKNIRLD